MIPNEGGVPSKGQSVYTGVNRETSRGCKNSLGYNTLEVCFESSFAVFISVSCGCKVMISKQQKASQHRRIKFYILGLSLIPKVSFVKELAFYFSVKMYTITIILFKNVTLSPTTVELLVLSVVYVPIKYFYSGAVGQTVFRAAFSKFWNVLPSMF